MKARTPSSSRVEMTQIVMPTHTNGVGGVLFGGTLVQWIDVCAAVAAMRHCGASVVTASIDRLDFLVPIHVGDVVVLPETAEEVRRHAEAKKRRSARLAAAGKGRGRNSRTPSARAGKTKPAERQLSSRSRRSSRTRA